MGQAPVIVVPESVIQEYMQVSRDICKEFELGAPEKAINQDINGIAMFRMLHKALNIPKDKMVYVSQCCKLCGNASQNRQRHEPTKKAAAAAVDVEAVAALLGAPAKK